LQSEKDKDILLFACAMAGPGHFTWMKKFVFFFRWKEPC